MKVQVSAIHANPHRNFDHNPIREDQVVKLVESIGRTGFWDNVVVRQKGDVYELAYGHNRMEAVRRAGITEVDVPVRDLSDWDMFLCMVDENNTQQNVTTEIVMENIGVGASLLESYIREAETAEQFAELVKSNQRPAPDGGSKHDGSYIKIRESVLSGCGVGKDLITTYIPDASKSNSVVSAVLEALYGEQRKKREAEKAAALKAEADKAAKEQAARKAEQEAAAARRAEQEAAAAAARRQAEQKAKDDAERRRRQEEAAAAERRAEQARKAEAEAVKRAADAAARQKKAEKEAADHDAAVKKAAREFGVAIEILRSFSSPTVMAEFAALVKANKIPAEFHVACAEACHAGGWSQKTMRIEIPKWWDVASGEQARRYKRMEDEAKRNAQAKKYQNGDLPGFIMKWLDGVTTSMLRASDVLEYIKYASPTLRKNLVTKLEAVVEQLNAIIKAAGEDDHQQEKEIVVETLPMLPHHNSGE